MRLATPSGFVNVRERAHPLAGLDSPQRWSNGISTVQLASLPGGAVQAATYSQVYRANPWVFSALRAISRGVSRLKVKTYTYDADGRRTQIRGDLPTGPGRRTSGEALDNLMRQPEPRVGRQEWLRKIVADRGVYGNSLVVKSRNAATGQIDGLYHVPWERVTVETGEDEPVLFYEVAPRGTSNIAGLGGAGVKRFSPDDVIHFGRGTDLNAPIGLSPLAPLKFTLALHDALWRHAVAYFENSARPSGQVKLDRSANEKTIEAVRTQIERLYTSPDAAGKVLVTSGEWQSMTDSASQQQIVELARLSREEIAAAFGIPQPMMGILDRAILNNVKELRNYFTRDTVGEEATAIEDDLMAQLVSATPAYAQAGIFLEFDLGEALRPDLEALADVSEKMRHVLTPNEQREKFLGMNPIDVEGADTVWMPSGQTGLGLEPPAPPEPPPAPPAEEDPPPAEDD